MKRNLMMTATMLLLYVASYGQSLRSEKYWEEHAINDTVKFVKNLRFGKPKPLKTFKPDGNQHWKLGLITKAGGDLIMHHDIEHGEYDPQWHPYVSAGIATGYMDDNGKFSLMGTYSIANDVVGNGMAQIAGIQFSVLSFYSQFGIRMDTKEAYDCTVGFKTSLTSIINATMEWDNETCGCYRDNLYFYFGATLRTASGQKNYAGFNTGLQYNLFTRN